MKNKLAFFTALLIICSGIALGGYTLNRDTAPRYVQALATTQPVQVTTSATASVRMPAPQALEVIELTADNVVIMDQVFDDNSVTKVMLDMQRMADKNPKVIYLVLNTPGGSVEAGLRLISFIKALPVNVKTLTLFSASMGFQTVQGLGERLILDTGTLMSHRAKFDVRGEGPGELFSRLKMIMTIVDRLDAIAAKRMGITFEAYRALVADEYYATGEDAVHDKSADRAVLARCSSALANGVREADVETMFGSATVRLSTCPLLPGILSVVPPKGETMNANTLNYVTKMFGSRIDFVNEYIVTNEWMRYQR